MKPAWRTLHREDLKDWIFTHRVLGQALKRSQISTLGSFMSSSSKTGMDPSGSKAAGVQITALEPQP